RRPTQPLLVERIKQGRKEPSPTTIRRLTGSFTAVLEAAGFPKYNRKLSPEEILTRGAEFRRVTGRAPSRKDTYEHDLAPGYKVIRNYFGTLKAFHEALEAYLNDEPNVTEEAA
ncbi:MAG TPA: hypothetical protein VFP32_01125, partial [Candidatus Saccharimonadales bacterium]|nr:hypothetical protein [Candidatus Saccharimonadales bacterium]